MLVASQDDGLLVVRDELAGWLGGIAEYKGGKGSDLGHWLAMWSAAPLTVDRKTGTIKMIHCPRASVSLVGGIQPAVLGRAIGRDHMQDGLCARLLLAMPEPRPVRWTEEIVDDKVELALHEVFDRLFTLESVTNAEGNPEPYSLDLTPVAKVAWIAYYDRHRAAGVDLDDDLAAAWSKLEAYTARLALIFQMCKWAVGDDVAGETIDKQSVTAAIELTDWFGNEAQRVYGMFCEDEAERQQRELVELIKRKGGEVTLRDLMRSSQKWPSSAKAEAALFELVKGGLGKWKNRRTTIRGGRPTRTFTLDGSDDVDRTQIKPAK